MEYMPNKLLITGGAGMIGSNLVKQLIVEKFIKKNDIYIIDNLWRGKIENIRDYIDIETNFYNRDLTQPDQLNDIIIDNNIDTVIHLADIVSGIGYVVKNEWFVFNQNILINSNTIKSIRTCSKIVKAFINIGTSCSFPQTLQTSIESKLSETQLYPADPETSYGWSKLMSIYETGLLEKETNILCCSLIFHNIYGTPCDVGERSQVIPALIKKVIEAPNNSSISVWGSGKQGRAFLHVDDAVRSIILSLKRGYNAGVIQIGPEKCTTIKEVAETIIKCSGKSIYIVYDTTKPEGDFGRCADFTKATEVLKWIPSIEISVGINNMYQYILKNVSISKLYPFPLQ